MPRFSTPKTLFGRRLREARLRTGIPQDQLGVLIGIDELTSSARISRYENGTHEPPFATAAKLAQALGVPAAVLYCDDDELARLVLAYGGLTPPLRQQLLQQALTLAEVAGPHAEATYPSP